MRLFVRGRERERGGVSARGKEEGVRERESVHEEAKDFEKSVAVVRK